MKQFTQVADLPNLEVAIQEAITVKKAPFIHQHLGKNKTLGLVFMNPSLRTRLSSQVAGQNLGMSVIVLNITKEGWQLETQDGVVMNGDKAEHVKDAIGVIGQYVDILGVRSFPKLENAQEDYSEKILLDFVKYAGVPVVSLESATRHPLQSFADVLTIEEHKKIAKPKVVLTWSPHPRALPQAVPNSFAEWMNAMDYEFVITHPKGYELHEAFTQNAKIEYDRQKAFEGADFIYAKNWSSFHDYGKILSQDATWTVDQKSMQWTNQAHFMHCLPVRRNVIVTDDVIDSPQSLILEQAKNRTISMQTILKRMLENL